MATLPPEFADLEPFADWCLPSEGERYAKRLASSMEEMQAFYDAAFPRLPDAMAYLDGFELDPAGTACVPDCRATMCDAGNHVERQGDACACVPDVCPLGEAQVQGAEPFQCTGTGSTPARCHLPM